MGTLSVGIIKSITSATPPTIQDSGGTQIGTFCRAWVNFNGTGTVAINASFNVTSITDNGVGDYTVNFTNAMPDANYSATALAGDSSNSGSKALFGAYSLTTGAFSFALTNYANTSQDKGTLLVSVFR